MDKYMLTTMHFMGWHVSALGHALRIIWVAVKELNLSYYIGETLVFTIYTHSGNLI